MCTQTIFYYPNTKKTINIVITMKFSSSAVTAVTKNYSEESINNSLTT